ncbi:MAG: hypothetical protein CMI31_00070 [Opitutae bacterium]|nr:hypothetical protein [Opitutae bacterium]
MMKIQNNDLVWGSCICGKQSESKVSKTTLQSMNKASDAYAAYLNRKEKEADNADNLATGMQIAIDSGDTDLMDMFEDEITEYVSNLDHGEDLPQNLEGHVVFDPRFSPDIKSSSNEAIIHQYVSSDSSNKLIYDESKYDLILSEISLKDVALYADVIKENITLEEACDYYPRKEEGCTKCGQIPVYYYPISHICNDPDEKYEEDFMLFHDRMSWCCPRCYYYLEYVYWDHPRIEYSSTVCTLCDYALDNNDEQLIRRKAFKNKHNDRLEHEEKIERKFIAKMLTSEEQDRFTFLTGNMDKVY